MDKVTVHILIHLVLASQMVFHKFFSEEGLIAHGTSTRTILLQVDGMIVPFSIAKATKGSATHQALATSTG